MWVYVLCSCSMYLIEVPLLFSLTSVFLSLHSVYKFLLKVIK